METNKKETKQKETTCVVYKNAVHVRLHNRRIELMETDKGFVLNFFNADKEPQKPACWHKVHKGKVRQTGIQLTKEAMEFLVGAYLQHRKAQAIASKESENKSNDNLNIEG